jgi:hypothetical protein
VEKNLFDKGGGRRRERKKERHTHRDSERERERERESCGPRAEEAEEGSDPETILGSEHSALLPLRSDSSGGCRQ